jgi:hypothetical protein
MTIDEILFDQYMLGRDDEAMAWRGDKRKPGGEITKAKKLILKKLDKQYIEGMKKGIDMVKEHQLEDAANTCSPLNKPDESFCGGNRG